MYGKCWSFPFLSQHFAFALRHLLYDSPDTQLFGLCHALAVLWGGSYERFSKSHTLSPSSLSSPDWDPYSWYFPSLKVTFLQGGNSAWMCQVLWPWECNWEISPSVRTLPEKSARVDADGGCKWSQSAALCGFTFWCPMSQQSVGIISELHMCF